MTSQRLADGSLRWRSPGCTLRLTRVQPGGLHLAIAGDDRGEAGRAVFEELDREIARFALPLRLWIDARRATTPPDAVRDAWTGWFARQRGGLERMDMLVPSSVLALTAALVAQLSHTERQVHVHSDPEAFAASLPFPVGETEPGPVAVSRREDAFGLELGDGSTRYAFRRLSPSVLRFDLAGRDAGRLGAEPIDELMARVAALARPRAVFLDASGVDGVAERVRQEWVAWIRAHREDWDTLALLAGSPVMRLTFALARESSGAGQRLHIYDDGAAFEDDLKRRLGTTTG